MKQNSIVEQMAQMGFRPKKTGNNRYNSPCPACGGKDRFVIWDGQDGGRYWCSRCKKSGTVSWFAREFRGEQYEPHEPFIPSFKHPHQIEKERAEAQIDPSLWKENAKVFLAWTQEQMKAKPDGLNWLKEKRGIKLQAVKKVGLGFNPRIQFCDREDWGLPQELNDKGKPKKLVFPEGIVIPSYSLARGLVRLRFRKLDPNQDMKYLVLAGSNSKEPLLLGPRKAKEALVVESELDAILLSQELPKVMVIGLGSVSIRPVEHLAKMLRKKRLLISLDEDEAGEAGTKWWLEQFPHAEFFPIIEGKDHTEAHLSGLDLKEWFSEGIHLIYGD